MLQLPLATSSTEVLEEKFWQSILLYYNRPHLVNRRLLGVSNVLFHEVNFRNENIKRITKMFTRSALLYEIRKLQEISKEAIPKTFIESILQPYDKNVTIEDASMVDFENSQEGVFVSIRILLSRQHMIQNCIEIVVLDKLHKVATFFAVSELNIKTLAPPFAYDLEYSTPGNVRICIQNFEDAETAAAEWLVDQLFPKLLKWAENADTDVTTQQSLSLIPVDIYTELYQNFKIKYGKKLVEMWTENTDPLKFVYEEIAIATYLILLWKLRTPDKMPSFVDLGCGNGVLVYILSSEGYPGYGIDIRKRKIWDHYPATTQLKAQTITPSASFLFPDVDWIIGNHADELTPWIPVITARSSYKANFFLLPCCCYEFNGQKHMRINTGISVYNDYLNYIADLSVQCGFIIDRDKLRIPSTKRTCIVSSSRSYKSTEFSEIDKNIIRLLEKHGGQTKHDSTGWLNSFQARPEAEKVRNCTQLDRNLIKTIVNEVTQKLLEQTNVTSKSDGENWNKGGEILLPDLAKIFGGQRLKELKKEFGGLKTLLKNHRYIFEVLEASVKLRSPPTFTETNGKYKDKLCWFYLNHPQGCFNDSDTCAYLHS